MPKSQQQQFVIDVDSVQSLHCAFTALFRSSRELEQVGS